MNRQRNTIKKILVTGLVMLLVFNAAAAFAEDTLPDDPNLLKAMVRMLRSSLKSRTVEIKELQTNNAWMKKQLVAADKRIEKLEALCKKNSIETLTPAEKGLAKKAKDAGFVALYTKYRKRYVAVNDAFYYIPKSPPNNVNGGLKVGVSFVFSGEVNEILGDTAMIADHLRVGRIGKGAWYWMDDKYTAIRLYGYPTKGFSDGQRVPVPRYNDKGYCIYQEIAVIIIGTVRENGTTLPLAVPIEYASAGLTKEQFATMLSKGIDPKKDDQVATAPAK